MGTRELPRGLLVDMDDTILTYDAVSDEAWRRTCAEQASRCGLADPLTLRRALEETRRWYWSDPERSRRGRLNLQPARAEVALLSLRCLGVDDADRAREVADAYARHHDALVGFFPGAEKALGELCRRGVKLALMTNGEASRQWGKVRRFGLERYLDLVLVEEDLGFGKPDPRVYEQALRELGMGPGDVWAIGDNLEADVRGPQGLGIFSIWNDFRQSGLPADSPVTPDRIVHRLAELLG